MYNVLLSFSLTTDVQNQVLINAFQIKESSKIRLHINPAEKPPEIQNQKIRIWLNSCSSSEVRALLLEFSEEGDWNNYNELHVEDTFSCHKRREETRGVRRTLMDARLGHSLSPARNFSRLPFQQRPGTGAQ